MFCGGTNNQQGKQETGWKECFAIICGGFIQQGEMEQSSVKFQFHKSFSWVSFGVKLRTLQKFSILQNHGANRE